MSFFLKNKLINPHKNKRNKKKTATKQFHLITNLTVAKVVDSMEQEQDHKVPFV